jgi:hypothetical protein
MALASIWTVRSGHLMIGYLGTVFSGVSALLFVIILHPRAAYLQLDANGFTFCSLFRSHTVNWSEVHEFGVMEVFPARVKMVGWNFVPGCARSPRGAAISMAMSGYQSGFPDTYGLEAEQLADLLNNLLKRHDEHN